MDHTLRKMMYDRQEIRRQLKVNQAEISSYIKNEIEQYAEDNASLEVVWEALRLAYMHGHMACTLQEFSTNLATPPEQLDSYVWRVLEKKGSLSRGQSTDRRTREEQRAYGAAKEAWSYVLKEVGLR